MRTTTIPFILLLSLLASCNNEVNVPTTKIPVVKEIGLKDAKLTRDKMLIVTNEKDEEIAYFRGVDSFKLTRNNLVTATNFSEGKNIIFYSRECEELFYMNNITLYQLEDEALATLDDDRELSLFDGNGDTLFTRRAIDDFELIDQGVIAQTREGLKFLSFNGTYELNLDDDNLRRYEFAGRGIVTLTLTGTLSYISTDGEIILQEDNVNYFYIDLTTGHLTYQLKDAERDIKNIEL